MTLRFRIFALVSTLLMSSMLAMAAWVLRDVGNRLHTSFEQRGSIIATYFARNSVNGIIIEDESGLNHEVALLFEIEEVLYATIYDNEGTQIIGRSAFSDDSHLAEIARGKPTFETKRVMIEQESRVPCLDFCEPAFDEDGERVGWVQVGMSLESIGSQVTAMATRAVILLAVFIGVGLVAAFFVAQSIANPIKALTLVFARIAGGDLDHEIDVSRTDEVGSLSVNFAAMRDSIRQKIGLLETEAFVRKKVERELKNHRDHLEELVDERTAELARSNESLMRAKEAAEKADRVKSEFLANVSHELRTPMHGVLSFASFGVAKADTAPREKLQKYFENIRVSGGRLMALVNALLDLSKLESGRNEFVFALCNLNRVTHSLVDEFRSLVSERDLTLEFLANIQGQVVVDRERMMQVLRNLIGNAIKYSSDGGTIQVHLYQKDGSVLIDVEDDGQGIPEDELEAVFDKFAQSERTKSGAGGTGLGLAICREILTGHKGRIWAVSGRERGTMLRVEIPDDLPVSDADRGAAA